MSGSEVSAVRVVICAYRLIVTNCSTVHYFFHCLMLSSLSNSQDMDVDAQFDKDDKDEIVGRLNEAIADLDEGAQLLLDDQQCSPQPYAQY